jgi:shikimate 5-dehydrogenase
VAIERAIAQTSDAYSPASEHLKQAVTLLARKPTPDYRNSIKESISAVEAICAAITGDPKTTLGQALKVIDKEAPLHGALRSAFEKLYGYTSDAQGIRHALMEEAKLEQEDAVFMLVACSAFVSYVIAKRARRKAVST